MAWQRSTTSPVLTSSGMTWPEFNNCVESIKGTIRYYERNAARPLVGVAPGEFKTGAQLADEERAFLERFERERRPEE